MGQGCPCLPWRTPEVDKPAANTGCESESKKSLLNRRISRPFGMRGTGGAGDATTFTVEGKDSKKCCSSCGSRSQVVTLRERTLCQECMRAEDEKLLGDITAEERKALDIMAVSLNAGWDYWRPDPQPAEVLPWLFLGGIDEIADMEVIDRCKITGVLSVISTQELEHRLQKQGTDSQNLMSLYDFKDVVFAEMPTEDSLTFELLDKWPAICAKLSEWHSEGRHVIISCIAGHNRSSAAVVLWLLAKEGVSLPDALECVQRLRGCILSNHRFRLSVARFCLANGIPLEKTSK
eukprot:gnl/TRDRNA2_/TRDRNA2_148894_c0_seq2.p1 gnl/TRDRNA2_/TRDRNA2_148894_c0~~gnl/TRDRNA2_/TRDRNA2_148894_c0_seq2.p1  ORF type:complete len:292 (+),score=52.96 gnl/TRDRNA2_/TRDRNA2_148894_c0_seq2:113-988(+)